MRGRVNKAEGVSHTKIDLRLAPEANACCSLDSRDDLRVREPLLSPPDSLWIKLKVKGSPTSDTELLVFISMPHQDIAWKSAYIPSRTVLPQFGNLVRPSTEVEYYGDIGTIPVKLRIRLAAMQREEASSTQLRWNLTALEWPYSI